MPGFKEGVMDYEKALEVMVRLALDEGDHVDPDDVGEAWMYAIQALNHCIKLGLDGNDAVPQCDSGRIGAEWSNIAGISKGD